MSFTQVTLLHHGVEVIVQFAANSSDASVKELITDAVNAPRGSPFKLYRQEPRGVLVAVNAQLPAGTYDVEVLPTAAGPLAPAGYVTRDEAEELIASALAASRTVESFNPYARSHHSDLTASAGSQGALALSPSSRSAELGIKVDVANYYGLTDPDPNYLTDMLGNRHRFDEVTRAHLYPKSYQNFHEFASYLSLPSSFLTGSDPRNFLLIDKELHDAFDDGFIGFIPNQSKSLTIRVFRSASVSSRVACLHGQTLHWPNKHHQPYRRILGWCAWLAKGATPVDPEVGQELEAVLDASDDVEGNKALKAAVKQALSVNKAVRSWLA